MGAGSGIALDAHGAFACPSQAAIIAGVVAWVPMKHNWPPIYRMPNPIQKGSKCLSKFA
jgi:hypothetical protein